jgi:hypothetical protein
MPWKLILFLFNLILATLFIGFNLDNRCDVSLLFRTFEDVPVFVSILFAYVAGALSVIPFIIGYRSAQKRKKTASSRSVDDGPKIRARDYGAD